MPKEYYPQCAIHVPNGGECVTRLLGNVIQTLIAYKKSLRPLHGSDTYTGLSLGPKIALCQAKAPGEAQNAPRQPFVPRFMLRSPTWDFWSGSVYAMCGSAIVRIAGDEVSLLAGSVEEHGLQDGPGSEARFSPPNWLASDGAGTLYSTADSKLRKVHLPSALRRDSGTDVSVTAERLSDVAVVSTLPFEAANELYGGLVHVPDPAGGPGSLVYATSTAMYRVQLGGAESAAAPVLLAGREGQRDSVDGRGEDARFVDIQGMTVDAHGNIVCVDKAWRVAGRLDDDDGGGDVSGGGGDARTPDSDDDGDQLPSAVRCVSPEGHVTTLVASVDGELFSPCILPNGYLSLCDDNNDKLVVLSLGLKPQPLTPPSTTTNKEPQPGSLPADWGALFEQPEATSDLILVAGERVFPVHRLVLSVRCEYFRRCLAEGTFAEGSAGQLALLDVDPDALGHVLRYMYTGVVDIPADLVCPVAELADRLLLPVLTAAACDHVWMGVTTETVADLLLWAERCAVRGGSFPQLLTDLKTWYVDHYDDVKREARESLRRLAAESPDLMLELYEMVTSALAEQPRCCVGCSRDSV